MTRAAVLTTTTTISHDDYVLFSTIFRSKGTHRLELNPAVSAGLYLTDSQGALSSTSQQITVSDIEMAE